MTHRKAIETRRLVAAANDGRVYRLDPPAESVGAYVLVSAAVVFGRTETYVFRCTEDGEVLDWCEAEGSLNGTLQHQDALDGIGEGYTIARQP